MANWLSIPVAQICAPLPHFSTEISCHGETTRICKFTFYDLKHIRASLEVFIDSLGFDSVLFEKGDITFHPDASLDESCYREAAAADIFVLIVGGRYGSASSSTIKGESGAYPKEYDSITRKEFDTAQDSDVPTFILIDSSVAAEYQTYRRNKERRDISYAHVDSPQVFSLIESIFSKSKNNPVFNFDRATQIENWLRDQWAGLFRELLKTRSQQKQLTALNSQVQELQSVSDTLKSYLESMLVKVNPDNSEKIILDEESKLEHKRKLIDLRENSFFRYLSSYFVGGEDSVFRFIFEPTNADQAIDMLQAAIDAMPSGINFPNYLTTVNRAQEDYNSTRQLIGLPPLDFSNAKNADAASVAIRQRIHGEVKRANLPRRERAKVGTKSEFIRPRDTFDALE